MKVVEFSLPARRDLGRLQEWLEERAPAVAGEAIATLLEAATSLAEFPERGARIQGGLRELIVPFGSAGYVLQYGVGRRRVIDRPHLPQPRRSLTSPDSPICPPWTQTAPPSPPPP